MTASMTDIRCAVCLYVEFLAVETDNQPPGVRPAVTLAEGTAVCASHLEDLYHLQPGGTRTVAEAARSIARAGGWLSSGWLYSDA